MDTSNLRKIHQKLMDFLIKNGYKKDSLLQTRKCIRLALEAGTSPEINSYEELFFLEVKKRGYKPEEGRYKHLRTYMGNVKQFDCKGIYPGGVGSKNGFLASPSLYDQLNTVFQSAIDNHFRLGGLHEKREKTVWTEARAAMNFFKHLQNCGAETFLDVENKMVYTFFFNGEQQIRGKDYCNLIKAALKTAVQLYGEPALNILEMLPSIKAGNKNFQYLTPEESTKIRECLENETSGLTHLERSVGWLLYFLGLRGTDISNLKPENIDWKHDRIHLIQSKTGEPLTMPMNAAIGNELFDYITTERPKNAAQTVLVTKSRPHGELKYLGGIARKLLRKSGVRTDGEPKGLRVLRHHLVTYLLSHGVECDVVSSIAGHSSPESIKPYADADIEHLRECSISVAEFPVSNELFEI
ncbi:Phage integrase family protein [Mariniphaga anaerophila]|uniref:Phage integrase family protein n=1 Tax=Mariniphaga anaerophila TaxID=1484053 RepID=A0A1M4WIT8_9BACT|nr:tyrosine-type recombinase/integrase [Mariniphaga anaerophila]SHE81124.1 Phage integrase family protein [Mariniphaga anaerophila]